jgi:cytochrome P450
MTHPTIQRVSDTQGRPAWLVSGHEQVRELLADPRLLRFPIRTGSVPTCSGCASC